MGGVYPADETRLRRWDALQVLSANLSSEAEHLVRYEREALDTSFLNHPNILTISHLVVSELISG